MSVPDQNNEPAPRRSRIVIDIGNDQQDTPAAQARRGSRSGGSGVKKVLLAIALLLVIVVAAGGIGGFLWYRGYQRTPAYSLALLADSVQRNDMQAFDRYVDLDRVTENFVPQVVERAGGNAGSVLGAIGGRGAAGAAAARMLPGVRDQVRDEFVRQAREVTARASNVPIFLIALAVPRFVDSITEEGETARVQLKIDNRPVELTMQHQPATDEGGDERWRVVSVRDDELATRIAAQLPSGALPQLPSQLPRQLPRRLPNLDDVPLNNDRRNERDERSERDERETNRNARRPPAPGSSPSPTPRRERQREEDILRDLPGLPIPQTV